MGQVLGETISRSRESLWAFRMLARKQGRVKGGWVTVYIRDVVEINVYSYGALN